MFRRRDEDENEYAVQPVNKNFVNSPSSGFPAAGQNNQSQNAQAQPAHNPYGQPALQNQPAQNSFLNDEPAQQSAVPFIKTTSSANAQAAANLSYTPAAATPPAPAPEAFVPPAQKAEVPAPAPVAAAPISTPTPAKEPKVTTAKSPSNSGVNSFVPSALRASSPATPEPKFTNSQANSTVSQVPTFTPKASNKGEINLSLETERRLTVGYGISLEGRVSDCDKLVIYGNVNAELNNVKALQISDSGCFRGVAEIDYAEISGVFEGELKIRKNIIINSTGRVSGKITYGSIEIKPGGKFTGEIVEDKALAEAAAAAEENKNQDDFNTFAADQKADRAA